MSSDEAYDLAAQCGGHFLWDEVIDIQLYGRFVV